MQTGCWFGPADQKTFHARSSSSDTQRSCVSEHEKKWSCEERRHLLCRVSEGVYSISLSFSCFALGLGIYMGKQLSTLATPTEGRKNSLVMCVACEVVYCHSSLFELDLPPCFYVSISSNSQIHYFIQTLLRHFTNLILFWPVSHLRIS